MHIPIEEPTVVYGEDKHTDARTTHPAYAQISCSRVSGSTSLYASDFKHQHYVTIKISASEHIRNLSNDWHHERGQLIEVAMSESQWAHFITSMNVGGGSPCTLQHVKGVGMIPRLPDPKPMTDRYSAELKKMLGERVESLQVIANKLTASDKAMSKTELKELGKRLDSLAYGFTGYTKFIADQFDEHVEGTVNKAKTEINAYALNTVVRAGLQSIAEAKANPILTIDLPKEDDDKPL